MAPPPKPESKPSGPIGYLTRKVKIFGVQVPVWVLFAVGVGGLYLYRKHQAAASTSTTPGTSTDTSGTAGADFGASGFDSSGAGDSGGGGSSGGAPSSTPTAAPPGGSVVVVPDTTQTPPPAPAAPTPAAGTGAAPSFEFPTAASTANFAAEASAKSAAAEAAGATPRFGGVSQVETLASGAVETVYASGRVVEQAPGKSAYVVSQGSSAGAGGTQNRAPVTPKPTRTAPTQTTAARNVAVTKAHSLKPVG